MLLKKIYMQLCNIGVRERVRVYISWMWCTDPQMFSGYFGI